MKGLGYRTIKTALATGVAVWLSYLLELDFYTSAGIIAILCIQTTKKRSIKSSFNRFFASMIALVLSGFFFEFTYYHPLMLSAFILMLTPLLVFFNIQEGFVTSIVITLHIFLTKDFTVQLFVNEVQLLVIGVGLALLVNSYMPNVTKEIHQYKKKIEQCFQVILYEFSAFLRDENRNWDGKELIEAEKLLNEAKATAIKHVENHLLRKNDKDYHYFEMREKQYELLTKIMPVVSNLNMDIKQRETFADFLAYLSNNVREKDTTDQSIQKLHVCKEGIAETELPKTREEFEARANLFYLMNEIQNYLDIKRLLHTKEQGIVI